MDFAYKRILIIASNHVGNNMFCTPGIRYLKKHLPEISLDVVTLNRRSVEVFHGNPDIVNVKVVARKRALQKLAQQYPYVIALHPDKTKEILQNLDTPIAVIPHWSGRQHRGDDVLEFMQTLVGQPITEQDRCYNLYSSSEHDNEIKHLLRTSLKDKDFPQHVIPAKAGIQNFQDVDSRFRGNDESQNILIGLHLGSGRTAVHGWKIWYKNRDKDSRLWPVENYIALAEQLTAINPQIKFVLTGSRNENFLAKKFLKKIPAINLVGKTSLPTLHALMKYLKIFISPDTGAIHVACSATVPSLIGLFGPTTPELTGPYPLRPQYTIIKKQSTQAITSQEICAIVLEKLQ